MPDISTAFRNQYRDNFMLLTQQMESVLQEGVMPEENMGPGEIKFIDQVAPIEFEQLAGRHSPTKLTDPDHQRRAIVPVPFSLAVLIDTQDELRAVANPQSAYSQELMAGANRLKDDVIIAAATGIALTGKDAGTPVPLPAAQIIADDFVESGSPAASNLTIGKLREAKKRLDNAEVPVDDRHLALSPDNLQSLLRTTEVTSTDFNIVKALVQGDVDTFLGFKFHMSTRLLLVGNIRSAFVWHRRGISLGFLQNVETRIDPRPDLNYSTQVYGRVDLGATRTEEVRVVEILTDETT